jgi:hypothetical protein
MGEYDAVPASPERQPFFGLKEPKPAAVKRKDGAKQYQIILPNTFGELLRVAQKLTGIGKMRVFVDGGKEITTERQYEMVEPGDVLIVVDSQGKKVDLSALLAGAQSGQEDGQRARMELGPQKHKLVKFTALSDYQEHFVKHEGVAVNRPCVPKGRLVDSVPREEQLRTAERQKFDAKHPWWKMTDFPFQSESASTYVEQPIHLRDSQKNSRKNLVSDFKLFAHRSNEPDVVLQTEKKSESQNHYNEFSKTEIEGCKAIPAAGQNIEVVTNTRTVPVDHQEAWWKESPFEYTSESRAHFKDPTRDGVGYKKQGLCTNATGENKECWDPDLRIAMERGSLAGSRRSSQDGGAYPPGYRR